MDTSSASSISGCSITDEIESCLFNASETIKYFGEDFWQLMNNSCGDIELTMESICFMDYLLKKNKCKTICDVMCGNARHILGLHQLGYNVTGIDINRQTLESVKDLSIYNSDINLIVADIREYSFSNRYDCISLLTSSLGYYGRDGDIQIFHNAYQNLNDRGIFLLDIPNVEDIRNNTKYRDWCKVDDKYYLFSSKIKSDIKYNIMRVINKDNVNEYYMKMQLYSIAELKELLHQIGFVCIDVYGDFYFTPISSYDNARRIQIVAQKLLT